MEIYENSLETSFNSPPSRHRITEMLEHAVDNPLVILSAESGAGKTTAVRTFARQSREKVIWVRLTHTNVYAGRFWELLSHSVRPWNRDLARAIAAEPFPTSPVALNDFLDQLAEAAKTSGKAIIVFDDFQLVPEGPVKELITCMVRTQTQQVSFILISGGEININLPGDVKPVRLDGQHLQFTKEEIRVYYTALDIVIDGELLDTVYRITEGWAAAVHMLGLQLKRGDPLTRQSVDSAVTLLFFLFEKELFEHWEPRIQEALVLLCMLEESPLELTMELTSLTGEELDKIFRTIPFIRYRTESGSFYYHTLFRQFLESKLYQYSTKLRYAFLRKAAGWYSKKGRLLEPLTYYLACKDYGRMEKALVKFNILQLSGDIAAAMADLLEQVPEEYLQGHPMLWFYSVLLHQMGGKYRRAEEQLRQLQAHVTTGSLTGDGRRALGEVHVMKGFLLLLEGDTRYVSVFKTASELLPEGSSIWNGEATNFVGSGNALSSGVCTVVEVKEGFFQAAPYFHILFGSWGRGVEFQAAAEADYCRGNLDEAVDWAGKALTVSVEHKQWDIAGGACYILLRTSMARGSLDDVEHYQSMLHRYAEIVPHQEYYLLPEIADFMLYHHLGLVHLAADWIQQEFRPELYRTFHNAGRELYAKAVYMAHCKQFYPALSLIDTATGICIDSGQWLAKIKLLLLKSLVYLELGQTQLGIRQFRDVYKLTEESGIIMPFVELAGASRDLTKALRALPSCGIPLEWLEDIEERAGAYHRTVRRLCEDYHKRHPQDRMSVQALSKRELEAYQLLCRGLSNVEIAGRMGIELSSIRIILSRVYKKMGAANRADAVRIGMGQGIR